jgi:hypothetical protein
MASRDEGKQQVDSCGRFMKACHTIKLMASQIGKELFQMVKKIWVKDLPTEVWKR